MEKETKLAGGGEMAQKRWVGELLNLTVRIFYLVLQLSDQPSARLSSLEARGGKPCRPPQHGSQGTSSQLTCDSLQIKLTVCEASLLQPQHHLRLPLLARNLEQPHPSQQPEHILRADSQPGKAGDKGGGHVRLLAPLRLKPEALL